LLHGGVAARGALILGALVGLDLGLVDRGLELRGGGRPARLQGGLLLGGLGVLPRGAGELVGVVARAGASAAQPGEEVGLLPRLRESEVLQNPLEEGI